MTQNLASLLRETAARTPHATAVIDGLDRSTYADLDRRARCLAAALHGLGIRRGERVALLLPNVAAFPLAYFACHYAGCPVVPLNVLLKADEIEYFLRDAQVAALVVHDSLLGEATVAAARVKTCRMVLAWRQNSIALPTGVLDAPALIEAATPLERDADTQADDTAVILYTSGTTGRPKGAELTHFNLLHNCRYVATELTPIDARSVALVALPLFHSFGQTVLQNAHFVAGGTLVLMRRFEAGEAFRLAVEHGVNYFAGVPTMYFALLHHPGATTIGSLRYCLSGGAAMPVEVMRAFDARFGVNILEGYGLSETSPVASFNVRDRPKKPGSIGLPIRGVSFELRDTRGVKVTATDQPGEIWIRGPNVMKGYWQRPEATAEAIQDGWFRTGDIAVVDADGYYRIVDRAKDMIIRGGFNVYPRELEEVLYTHAAIAETAVIGVPDARHGEEIKACVVLKAGHAVTPAELLAWCRERMAAYKYPRLVEILPSLPKGPTGKIQKRALRDREPHS